MNFKMLGMFAVFLILLAPLVQAIDRWEAVCIGETLIENTTLTVNGDTIPITRNTSCSYGCDSGRRMCIPYSGEPGVATPLVLFLAVEAVALLLLVWSFVGVEILHKLISAVMAAILLFPLGLMSFNVLVDGMGMVFEWLAWLNFALAFIAVSITLYSMFMLFKEELT